jgi:hypothetical protein
MFLGHGVTEGASVDASIQGDGRHKKDDSHQQDDEPGKGFGPQRKTPYEPRGKQANEAKRYQNEGRDDGDQHGPAPLAQRKRRDEDWREEKGKKNRQACNGMLRSPFH